MNFWTNSLESIRRYATHRDMESAWSRRGGNYGSNGPGGKFSDLWKRWRVPLLFTAGALAFNHIVLPYAVSPFRFLRRNPEYAVYGLIALNLLGFMAWRVPAASRFMSRYGLLQKDPRSFTPWSMLGSAFSHQEFWHLGINMFVLYQFGIPVARWLGATDFLQGYLDGAVLSSLGSLCLPYIFRGTSLFPSLGASGAIYSVFGVFSYLAPNARLALWFIPLPIGAWYVFLITVASSAFQVVRRANTGFDHAGHLAGALAGIGWGAVVTQKIKKAREERAKREAASLSKLWW